MTIKFGLHTGPQNCTLDELRRIWRLADNSGFHWISVWDHFYPAVFNQPSGSCLEAVATMTSLAAETSRVRVGCLVFCVLYRHPAVLANAAVTIDHVSNGRMEIGLGAGWHQEECQAYGIPFPAIKDRLDQLEEATQVIRSLLTEEKTTFMGKYYQLADAYCNPRPVQKSPRIWIGGQGERRLLRIAARYADGWNVPFVSPETYAQKNTVLTAWCEKEGRDPTAVLRSTNVGLALAPDEARTLRQRERLEEQFGAAFAILEEGMLIGTPQQVTDRIGAYMDAGAQWLIIAVRAPFDWEGFQLFIDKVMPAFQ